jgi:hypothetical protein
MVANHNEAHLITPKRNCLSVMWQEDPGLPDFSWHMIPKPEKMNQMNTNCTIGHKISQISINIPNDHTDIFQSKTPQNLPKLGCLV